MNNIKLEEKKHNKRRNENREKCVKSWLKVFLSQNFAITHTSNLSLFFFAISFAHYAKRFESDTICNL